MGNYGQAQFQQAALAAKARCVCAQATRRSLVTESARAGVELTLLEPGVSGVSPGRISQIHRLAEAEKPAPERPGPSFLLPKWVAYRLAKHDPRAARPCPLRLSSISVIPLFSLINLVIPRILILGVGIFYKS